jgi:hypothetical protein
VDDDQAMGNGEFVHIPLNLDIQFPLLETPILPSFRHVCYLRNGLMRRWGFGRHVWGIWMRGRMLRLLLCDQQGLDTIVGRWVVTYGIPSHSIDLIQLRGAVSAVQRQFGEVRMPIRKHEFPSIPRVDFQNTYHDCLGYSLSEWQTGSRRIDVSSV